MSENETENTQADGPKKYYFGGIKEFDLEQIESEILDDSVYLDVFAGSDIRYKKNLSPMVDSLAKLQQIQGVEYDYKTEEFPDQKFPQIKQFGFVAQDIKKIIPHIVRKNKENYAEINYGLLTPLLVEGLKELGQTVKELKQEIQLLKNK